MVNAFDTILVFVRALLMSKALVICCNEELKRDGGVQ